MRRFRRLLLLALVLGCAAADRESLVFQGSYTWGSDAEGPLEVVFIPNGSKSWEVDFNFQYLGQPQTWNGTAQGDPRVGLVEGMVDSDNPELGYVFRGESRDGLFEGTHAELIDGVEEPSGELRFTR